MNPHRQYELMKEAQKSLDQGYTLMREALREGPVRLNREESLDIWRATTHLVEDILPALEVFIREDLHNLMDPDEKTLTRKQIWRLHYLKRDHNIQSYTDISMVEDKEALDQQERQDKWEKENADYLKWRAAEKLATQEWLDGVKSIYLKFGLYPPKRKCLGTTKTGAKCNNSANRFSHESMCALHSGIGSVLRLMAAEWELYFDMTILDFDFYVAEMFSKHSTVKRLAEKFYSQD